ncbi:MAG: hypothetical protein LBQ62_08720 [Candidatus Accumulibacter sp.]|jgi:hypothetical protein|nr:hypothetical protein [Accumulibacter sp.]
MNHRFARLFSVMTVCSFLAVIGCSSVNVALDPTSIQNRERFRQDYRACQEIAETYDLSGDIATNSVLGAAVGATTVAGIATAIAGTVLMPAVPFIVAGGALGGGFGGGMTKSKENAARETILSDCLKDKGYKTFRAQ